MKMQDISHKSGDYARPNLNWRCGREQCCQFGPTVDGQCGDTDEPCVPKRSVKSKKRLAAIWLFCVVIAIMTVFLSASALLTRVSPGPVSSSHSEVAGCQDCHSVANSKISTWIKVAAANIIDSDASLKDGHNDDQQCLTCHALGENAFLAHSTSPKNFSEVDKASLADLTSSPLGWKLSMASKWREMQGVTDTEVSCSTCHREHKGELKPRVNFDAQKCHTCHQVKFDELEVGHPQYSNFPHSKPTHIKFDHSTHLEKHFFEDDYFERSPDGCKQCHDTDQTGEWMLTNGFEDTCSSCHLDDVLGVNRATSKGIAVLTIPELDVQTLNDAGYNIGEWPAWADGELTPFMHVLLPKSLKDTSLFQSKQLVLYDLSSADPEQLKSAALLAWEIKRLFYELLVGGTAVIDQRLTNALGKKLDKSTVNRLVAALPKDTLLNNQQEWFPGLMTEVQAYLAGEIQLNSDPNLIPDLKLTVQDDKTQTSKPLDTSDILSDDSDILSDDDSDILSDDDSDILSDDDSDILSDDDSDILSDDDSDILSDDDSDILSDDDSDILSDDDSGILSDDDSGILSDDDSGEANENQEITDTLQEVRSDEDWALSGGWFRDGSSIRYRPTDHADLFFKTWLDVSAEQCETLDHSLFKALSADKSVGNCTKCHTIQSSTIELDPISPSTEPEVVPVFKMHWKSFKPSDVHVDFNRFSHVSHFSLMTDDGCSSCHAINLDGEYDSGIDSQSTPAMTPASGFLNMERETCTQCHQKGRAPDNCLTCHNYHAEPHLQSIDIMPDTFSGSE